MHSISRRSFGAMLVGHFMVLPASYLCSAQEAKSPRVGLIFLGDAGPNYDTIRKGLEQLGYVEGKTIAFEARFARGKLDRLPEIAAELARLNVDVIAAVGAVGARAAMKATEKIPIVFVAVIDPVATKFASSLERPGGNVTGIMAFDPQLPRKQLELLKEVLPKLARVAILSDLDVADAFGKATEAAARALGLQPQMIKVRGPAPDLEGAFSAMIKEGAEALVVLEVPVTIDHQMRIGELAARHRLPALFPGGQANAGGLITFGTSILNTVPRIPDYVDRILKGARPSEMPIEVITRLELMINLKTAKEIGATIPTELIKRADRVIE